MYDCAMPDASGDTGTPIDRAKLASIGVIGKRTKPEVDGGRSHPESGLRWKSVTTELGTVTEHGDPGTGVSVRQDVNITPQPAELRL